MLSVFLPAMIAAHKPAVLTVGSMTGTMVWARGILAANATVTNAAQTLSVTTSTGTGSYSGVLVTAPVGTALPQGTPIWVLVQGSAPFAALFANKMIIADSSGNATGGGRSVGIDTTGKTLNSIGFLNPGFSYATLSSTAFSAGGYNFTGGLTLKLADTPTAYTATFNNFNANVSGSFTFSSLPAARSISGSFSGIGLTGAPRGVGGINPLPFEGSLITPMGSSAGTNLSSATLTITVANGL